jgi:ATP-dependent DNA helicase RecG
MRTEAVADGKSFLEPIYPSTEKLKTRALNGRQIGKLTAVMLSQVVRKRYSRKYSCIYFGKLKAVLVVIRHSLIFISLKP